MSDTIAALATPVGTAALAVIRASGPGCAALAQALSGRPAEPRRVRLIRYHGADGERIDEAMLTFFAGPASYTGEDALELTTHGNPFIAQKVLEDLFARGCRAAEPGEFTRRAFLNGRMDLSQAEAVMDLIAARSERALAAAHRQLDGALTREMNALTSRLIAALAQVEAYIDFPEEDLPPENLAELAALVADLQARTGSLLATRHYGEVLREGFRVVLVGAVNAGKSSLLNALLGRDRALVSPEPGTTRDFLEEAAMIGPHLFRLIDTAGFNSQPGAVEAMGLARTREWIGAADLVLFLGEASGAWAEPPELAGRPVLRVASKIDLAPAPRQAELGVSTVTGAGIEALRSALVARADALRPEGGPEAVAINARHAQALGEARACLQAAAAQLAGAPDSALLASDLRGALEAFGRIAGRIDHERVLDELFAAFCIGK